MSAIDSLADLPDLFIIELLKSLDCRSLLNLSECCRRFFYMTKKLIEERHFITFDFDADSLDHTRLLRNYDSLALKCIFGDDFFANENIYRNCSVLAYRAMNEAKEKKDKETKSRFKAIIRQFSENLRSLSLSGCIESDKFFCKIVNKLPVLQSLIIEDLEFGDNRMDSFIQSQNLEVLELHQYSCSNLMCFYKCCNHLREFKFSFSYEDDDVVLAKGRYKSLATLMLIQTDIYLADVICCNYFSFKRNSQMDINYLEMCYDYEWERFADALYQLLQFIFALEKLETLIFQNGLDSRYCPSNTFRQANKNLNLKTLKLPHSEKYDDAGRVLRKFCEIYPSIEELEFEVIDKFRNITFTTINGLKNLKRMKITCANRKFKLSKINVGKTLTEFSYQGPDLNLYEWEKFLKNHKKIRSLLVNIRGVKKDVAWFVESLLELEDLKEIMIITENNMDELKELLEKEFKNLSLIAINSFEDGISSDSDTWSTDVSDDVCSIDSDN